MGTSVVFLNQMQQYRPPPVEFPYLPTVTSSAGKLLMEACQTTADSPAAAAAMQGPVIAHQLCALQMFQARINRSRYDIIILLFLSI